MCYILIDSPCVKPAIKIIVPTEQSPSHENKDEEYPKGSKLATTDNTSTVQITSPSARNTESENKHTGYIIIFFIKNYCSKLF